MTAANNGDTRLIDRWFPVDAVDKACETPEGSGRVEKAIFTWFASRPIAQARAAALTALLPADDALKPLVEAAILAGAPDDMNALAERVVGHNGGTPPVVLDVFSGRAILPLEAARAGAKAIGVDLSPVATLAGRLLADYPSRDWSGEPPVPFDPVKSGTLDLDAGGDRLAGDVDRVLAEVGRRVAVAMEPYYPRNGDGKFPWGYLWVVTIPCDGCRRRFPLLGSLTLKHPNNKTSDPGQSIHLAVDGDRWRAAVVDGPPTQQPTYSSTTRADGTKKKGKSARCLFCQHVHPLDTVKAKGDADEYHDELIVVADFDADGKRFFREPTAAELDAATADRMLDVDYEWPYPAVPDEAIPAGNVHTVMASGYGYRTFGELANDRQTRSFIETAHAAREVHRDLLAAGVSPDYARALTSFAASTLCRRLRLATRGARLRQHGKPDGSKNNNTQVGDLFSNEASVNFQFDYFEAGPGDGAGTWGSVSSTAVAAVRKVLASHRGAPVSARQGSATALPFRDGSIDAVICDPPYYDMIEYADASDLFHVWLKRVLFDIEPDLFGPDAQETTGLQDKDQEIIVRRVHEPGRVRHDTDFYETMLAKSFAEARRVLTGDGHLVVVFGHSDPDAWRRLLGALQTAGFVVTAAWPSRTESGNQGVASIKVTITIGCRVAPANRPIGVAAAVDREVATAVSERVRQWDDDGLALEDQLMASYGPAMEVYGRYSDVLNPDGTTATLDRYLNIARRAVRDSTAMRVDQLPLETFDAFTRFGIFWLRAKGRSDVPKGEAVFFAQADELHIQDLKDRVLAESKSGFRLRLDDPGTVGPGSSTLEVVRAMAAAWDAGGTEAVTEVMAAAERDANDQHLWAVVADLSHNLPAADTVAKALAGIKRSASTITVLVGASRAAHEQSALFEENN